MRQTTAWVLVILWMAFIFYFSHQPGTESSDLSGSVMQWILAILPFGLEESEAFHFLVRKGAHVFVYFVLAILVMNAVRFHTEKMLTRIGIGLLLSLLYAASDEYHQTFIEGRAGQVSDVFIDSIGIMLGISVFVLWHRKRVSNN
ncbi:VanZ family protein [Alkalibacillus flavidus]|uniref:VanZ family protein n=1 Tax=Alkalibacillus flavidus TaxID=546021 RepID=A0ABV2KU00_9BACI